MAFRVTNTASKGLMAYIQKADNQSLSAVSEMGKMVLAASQKRVPVKSGKLKSTGKLTLTGTKLNRKASVSYSTEYAFFIHENMNIRHPEHAGYNCGGDAKYLTGPLYELTQAVLALAAARMAP